MDNQAISALIPDHAKAEEMIRALVEAGVNPNKISILSSNKETIPENKQSEKIAEKTRNWRTEERIAGFHIGDQSGKYTPQRINAFEKQTKASEGATAGATTGGLVGGTLGLLAGIGALAIPGIGPLIAAGPLMAALSGIGAGGSIGSVLGALIGLGIPEKEAIRYKDRLKEGTVLLSVQTDSDEHANEIANILLRLGAVDISITKKAAVHALKQ